MCEYTETAQAVRAETPVANPERAPIQTWAVVSDNPIDDNVFACRTLTVAQAQCILYDHRFPSLAPHRVVRLREVSE